MRNTTKGKIIKALAIIIDVAAPLVATLTQFPIWVEKSSEATFSGMFILCAFLSCLPFINYIKEYLKSPSILVTWLIAFVLLLALNSIIEQMIVVCFVGLLANCIGAIIYKLGKHIELRPDKE